MRGAAIAIAVGLLLAAAGCSDDEDSDARDCAGGRCPDACEQLSGAPCDVLDERCQKRVLRAVVCARGTPGRLPVIRVRTQAELDMEHDAGADAGSGDAGTADGGTATPADDLAAQWTIAWVLLDMLPADADERERASVKQDNFVAGYYDADERRITLIDRDRPQDDWNAMTLFAHELVHALQDQTVGSLSLWERSGYVSDAVFAHGCLIEGEANLYAALATALLRGTSFDEAYFDQATARSLKYARRALVDMTAPVGALWRLRYPIGTRYLFDAYRQDGHWAVQALFEAPPNASVHWMVGYEQNTTRREHLLLPLACEQAQAPAGYRLLDDTSWGAAMLFAFLAHTLPEANGVLASEEHWRNALRWRQDRFSVFENDAGQVAVSYRIRFDDAALARELGAALAASPRVALAVRRHGAELELLAAEDPELLEQARADASLWQTDPNACPASE